MRIMQIMRIVILVMHLLVGVAIGKEEPRCAFLSRQYDHQVLIYRDVPNPRHPPKLKLESGTDIGAVETNYQPTGVAYHDGVLYAASYGSTGLRSAKKPSRPSIEKFAVKSEIKKLGTFIEDQHLDACFPEDITIHEGILYIGCGVEKAGILKYELATGDFIGKLAEGDCCAAVWGIAAHQNYIYFSSHCTSIHQCDRATQDKIYRVPLNGGPQEVQVFASTQNQPTLRGGGFGDLTFGPDGNLYVTSLPNEDVLMFNPLGGFVKKLKVNGVTYPVSIEFHNSKGYVTDPQRSRVIEFTMETPDSDIKQASFAVPGPHLNSKLMYITWGDCPEIDYIRKPEL